MFGTVHNRTIFAIVMVNFVSVSGFGLMFPVFATFGNQIGASATDLAWAIAGFSTGQLIAAPITGRLSDHFGRKPVLIICLLLGSIAYWMNGYADSPAVLIAARFGAGLVSGGFTVAFAIAADISTRDTRAKIMGIVGAGFSAGIIFGPAIGGFFGSLVPEEQAFVTVCRASAVLYLIAAAVTALLLPETRRQQPKRAMAPTGDNRNALITNPAFFVPVLIGFAAMSSVAMMEGTFAVYAQRILALSPAEIGMVFAAMGTCSVLVQVTLTGHLAKRFGEYGMLILAMIVQASGLICLGLSSELPLVVAGILAIAAGYAILTPAVTTLASFAADDESQGMAQGLVQGASAMGRIIGPVAAGPIYDGFSPTAPFMTGGILLLIPIVLTILWRPPAPTSTPERA